MSYNSSNTRIYCNIWCPSQDSESQVSSLHGCPHINHIIKNPISVLKPNHYIHVQQVSYQGKYIVILILDMCAEYMLCIKNQLSKFFLQTLSLFKLLAIANVSQKCPKISLNTNFNSYHFICYY